MTLTVTSSTVKIPTARDGGRKRRAAPTSEMRPAAVVLVCAEVQDMADSLYARCHVDEQEHGACDRSTDITPSDRYVPPWFVPRDLQRAHDDASESRAATDGGGNGSDCFEQWGRHAFEPARCRVTEQCCRVTVGRESLVRAGAARAARFPSGACPRRGRRGAGSRAGGGPSRSSSRRAGRGSACWPR